METTLNKIHVRPAEECDGHFPEIVKWIKASHWGWWQTEDQIWGALTFSNPIAAWVDGEMVGFVRFITDRYSNSMITDLYVHDQFRGRGIGRALMEFVLAHDDVKSTICILNTRIETIPFYGRFGFHCVGDSGVMKRDPA